MTKGTKSQTTPLYINQMEKDTCEHYKYLGETITEKNNNWAIKNIINDNGENSWIPDNPDQTGNAQIRPRLQCNARPRHTQRINKQAVEVAKTVHRYPVLAGNLLQQLCLCVRPRIVRCRVEAIVYILS